MAQLLISGSSPGPPPEYSPPDELSNSSNLDETPVLETSTITAQTDTLPMSSATPTLSNHAHSPHNHHRYHYHYHRHRREYRLARQLSLSQSNHHHHHRLYHYHHHHSNSSGQNSRSLSNEKSPFLIVKILLFSLMTIDFVMNTIGLAVMIVIVKNHYNNFIVEHSFLIRSGYSSPTSTPNINHHYTPSPSGSMPFDSDFLPNPSMTDSSNGGSAGSAAQSEWSLLLPLLPSFIFAEILTLIGMFGVFCDLFSFTMTYAILKLITSLCYPSMASVAAVAAMATATSSSSTSSTLNSMVMMPPGPPPPSSLVNNFTTNIDFVPMVVLKDISATSNNNSQKTTNVFYDDQSSFVQSLTTISSNTADSLTTASPLFLDFTTTVNGNLTLFNNTNINGSMSSPELSAQQQLNKVTSLPTMVVKEQQTNYKNAGWLKNYEMINKDFRQMKKNDRLAKLKAREKQLRNRLLKLESLELIKNNNGGHHLNNQSSSLSSLSLPLINRIKNGDKSKQWIFDSTQLSSSSPLFSPAQTSNQLHLSSVLMPMDSNTHNIKYHHRVWDALLVTFEVIFAVAFAFNLLSNKRDQDSSHNNHNYNHHRNHNLADDEHLFDMDLDEDSSPSINNYIAHRHTTSSGRQRRNRIGYYRSRHHYWPYSPLATNIDAFYFTYFRLPPPPPPYFCNRNELSIQRSQSSDNNQQSSSNSNCSGNSNNRIRSQLARSLFEGRHFRRLTPSWLLYSGVRSANIDGRARQNQINNLGERRSTNNRTIVIDNDNLAPPHYEDIERDYPINVITLTHTTTAANRPDDISVTIENDEQNQQSLPTSERIITLQVIGDDTSSANNRYPSNISEISSRVPTIMDEDTQSNKNVETLNNSHTAATESNSRNMASNIPTIIELVVNDPQQKDAITAIVNKNDEETNDNINHSQNEKMEQDNNNNSNANNNDNNCSEMDDKEEINKIKVTKKKNKKKERNLKMVEDKTGNNNGNDDLDNVIISNGGIDGTSNDLYRTTIIDTKV